MPLLTVRNLNVIIPTDHGALHAVRGVDLDVERGECLGIVGESGSGKSMTGLSLIGLTPRGARRQAEQMQLDEMDLAAMSERDLAQQIRGRRIGFVFQEPMTSLNPVYSIGQQLMAPMLLHGTADRRAAEKRAHDLLERVGIPDATGRFRAYPHQLSGGQRQRVMIAMALMNQPDLLIADEPTTALDVTVQAQILDLLDDLRRDFGMGLILVSHNLGVVSRVADRVSVMYAGEAVETGSARTVFRAPRHPYTLGLMAAAPEAPNRIPGAHLYAIPGVVRSIYATPTACIFADRCAFRQDDCLEERPPLRQVEAAAFRCILPDGAPVAAAEQLAVPARAPASERRLLTVSGLSKSYKVLRGPFRRPDSLRAVHDVSLQVNTGETLAIVGESGCGKSTLARMLVGLEEPDDGIISLGGKRLDGVSALKKAGLMQLVFQDPQGSLNPSHTVRQIVRRPLDLLGIGSRAERDARVGTLLHQVGLPARSHDAPPARLSGGQRQRVAIARALAPSPQLLVCDEPTSALDVSVQAQILNLLLDLRAQMGLAMILISHDLGVVGHMADRIIVMYKGQIVESGSAQSVLNGPQHDYTRTLLAATPSLDLASTQYRTDRSQSGRAAG